MRQRTLRLAALNASLLACMCAHSALAAPGEDPVTITGKVVYLQLPTAGPARSTALNLKPTMPDEAQAIRAADGRRQDRKRCGHHDTNQLHEHHLHAVGGQQFGARQSQPEQIHVE